MDADVVFKMHIGDGHAFRHVIAMIKAETDKATLILEPNKISICVTNMMNRATHVIELNPPELSSYKFNARTPKGVLENRYPVGFCVSDMMTATKGISRKDAVIIYYLKGDDKICVQPLTAKSRNAGATDAFFVKLAITEPARYTEDAYGCEPLKILASEISSICSRAGPAKCSSLKAIIKSNNVDFIGIKKDGSMGFVTNVKSSDYEVLNSTVVISEVDLPLTTAKALARINNISQQGSLVKLYTCEGKPLKITSNISTYGTYDVYINVQST